jgi:predicted O-methyltransferase YrrM
VLGLSRRQLAVAALAGALALFVVVTGMLGELDLAVTGLGLIGAAALTLLLDQRLRLGKIVQQQREIVRTEANKIRSDVVAGVAAERLAAVERHIESRQLFTELEEQAKNRQAALRWHLRRLEFEPVRQVEALLQPRRRIEPRAPLPGSGGWALEPVSLLWLTHLVVAQRPSLVVECGSGTSTIWLGYALQMTGGGQVVALEHDAHFREITEAAIQEHALQSVAEVRDAPLEKLEIAGEVFAWYSPNALERLNQVDLLLIDGPPNNTGPMARYPAIPVFASRLSRGAVVVIDDAYRESDADAVARWIHEYPHLVPRDSVAGESSIRVFSYQDQGD